MTNANSPFEIFSQLRRLKMVEDLAETPTTDRMLSVLGSAKGFNRLPERTTATVLAVRAINQDQLATIARMPWLEGLSIWGFRGDSLAPLTALTRLTVLSIGWAPKLDTIDDIGELTGLIGLGLAEMTRVEDLSPVSRLTGLKALAISGSFTKAQRLRSLAPVAQLAALTELSLDGVRVDNDDLRPIARLRHLQRLQLGRGFLVREYARLSVALAHLECEAFAPTSRIEHKTWDPVGHKSVQNPGMPETVLIAKPIKLVSAADPKGAALIAKRKLEHEHWQAHYRSVPDPAEDNLMQLPTEPKPKARRPKRKP